MPRNRLTKRSQTALTEAVDMPTVICVSGMDGAGRHEIGRRLAAQIGYRCVDNEILLAAANVERAFPEALWQVETRHPGRLIGVDFNRYEKAETLREAIREAVAAAADEGKVVIVGHAARYALADRDDALRVLVTASERKRLLRIAESERIDEKSAVKVLKELDKQREAYLRRFYGIRHERPVDYDLVINTDRLSTATAVELIVRAAGSSERRPDI